MRSSRGSPARSRLFEIDQPTARIGRTGTNRTVPSAAKPLSRTVATVDASNATAATPTYRDIGTGATVTQTYNAAGAPTNMKIYHSWIDPATYTESGAGDLVTYSASYGALGGTLPAGTYRLRVDTLEWNGAIPNSSGNSIA